MINLSYRLFYQAFNYAMGIGSRWIILTFATDISRALITPILGGGGMEAEEV